MHKIEKFQNKSDGKEKDKTKDKDKKDDDDDAIFGKPAEMEFTNIGYAHDRSNMYGHSIPYFGQ